jgi:hypothetical protein
MLAVTMVKQTDSKDNLSNQKCDYHGRHTCYNPGNDEATVQNVVGNSFVPEQVVLDARAYLQPAAYRQRISSRLDCNQGIMNIQLSELAVASRPALSVGDAFGAVNRLRD